jgi:hypothetical protein
MRQRNSTEAGSFPRDRRVRCAAPYLRRNRRMHANEPYFCERMSVDAPDYLAKDDL